MTRYLPALALSLILGCFSVSLGAEYEIVRNNDGPFAFSISGVKLNEGSTLLRESILFNDPSCPVQLVSHSTGFSYKDRGFRYTGTTALEVTAPASAVEVRTSLFDVFGQHMSNLSNSEPRDFAAGTIELNGEWRASDNDVSELLTSVTYIARVRLADGRQWIWSRDNLGIALKSLDLENAIDDEN